MTGGRAEPCSPASSAGDISTASEPIISSSRIAERKWVGEASSCHCAGHPPTVMPPAQYLIRDLMWCVVLICIRNGHRIPHHELITHQHHFTVHGTGIASRTLATPAQCLDLKDLDPVAQLNKPLGSGKQPGLKVGEETH